MRNRHFPRLCRSCEAPMACQEDTCWNCGAVWDYRSEQRNASRVIPGPHAGRPDRELVGARAAGRVRP
jgi:predicted amidophosphoribosyltransferase